MAMVDTVRSEMMAAMKAKDSKRKDVLSSLLAALKNGVINKRADLTEEEEIEIVSRELKQTRETLETAPADRVDIREECAYKISLLETFLPKQLTEEEIRQTITQVLSELGLTQPTPRDKGPIMKLLMPRVKGKADGKLVNSILSGYFTA